MADKSTAQNGTAEQQLLSLVIHDDVQGARDLFDAQLWQDQPVEATWLHLREALVRDNKPMMRLLITWGAKPVENEIQDLKTQDPARFEERMMMLYRAGLRKYMLTHLPHLFNVNAMPDETHKTSSVAKEPLHPSQIPGEWQHILKCFQDAGAEEAIIAGGAPRDLQHGVPISDVDIFITSRFSNIKLIKKAFAASGLDIVPQQVTYDVQARHITHLYPGNTFTKQHNVLKDTSANQTLIAPTGEYSHWQASHLTSWVVQTPHTKYNIIAVGGALGRRLQYPSVEMLLDAFDFGICQIAYDGKKIYTTKIYDEETRDQIINLGKYSQAKPNAEHLERIMRKYPAPDWSLSDKTRLIFFNPDDKIIEKIPEQWKRVLDSFKNQGAKEALIAGGAIRDTAHDAPVRDVDIFIKDAGPFTERRIKSAIEKAGLEIVNTRENADPNYGPRFWKQSKKEGVTIGTKREVYFNIKEECKTSSWVIRTRDPASATPHKTTDYNIIAISGCIGKQMRYSPGDVITTFDIGLCQIAFDGQRLIKTNAYKTDADSKTITIIRSNGGTNDHLRRVHQKYKDWTLCAEGQKIITPPAPPKKKTALAPSPKPSSGNRGGYYGGYSSDSYS